MGILYEDKDGSWQALSGFKKFHPTEDIKMTHQWLGYYHWYLSVCSFFLIYITKAEYKRNKVSSIPGISPGIFQQPMQARTLEDEDGLKPTGLVERVLGLETHGDEVSIH